MGVERTMFSAVVVYGWLLLLISVTPSSCEGEQGAAGVINLVEVAVGPGEFDKCAAATTKNGVDKVRCLLAPGVYHQSFVYSGHVPLEIVGSADAPTVFDGTESIANASWQKFNASDPDDGRWFTPIVDPAQRLDYRQAFQVLASGGDENTSSSLVWMPEARFPNTDIDKVLKLKSAWGFCGTGSAKGKCVDRADAWSDLSKPNAFGVHVDWEGGLATLNIAARYATYTRTVKSATKKQFTFAGNLGPGPGSSGSWVGGRYYLSGKFDALDVPGEWFVDQENWTAFAWMPDGESPVLDGGDDRFRLKTVDYCVDLSNTAVALVNVSFRGCTFRIQNCTADCLVSDVELDFPSYTRDLHLRDPNGPFTNGPPPNHTLFEADNSRVERVVLRNSNAAGLKVVGSNNSLEELLIEKCDWLGTLDYPPLELGFDHDKVTNTSAGFGMYPRYTHGQNNSVTRATIRHGGNALVVTSQLSNEVSFSHIYDGGKIGLDDALLHADNSNVNCMNYAIPLEKRDDCVKVWHHNWVHDGEGKCVRGDDYTLNLTLHHNVIWNCGEPVSDGAGQSFGVVLKGDYNRFFANTVLKTTQADVVADTAKDTKLGLSQQNRHSEWANSVAHQWDGKGGPSPANPQTATFAFWGGMHTDKVSTSLFENFSGWDFRPSETSSLIGGGVIYDDGTMTSNNDSSPDIGAYQRNDTGDAYWTPGCTFVAECAFDHGL